MLLERAAHSVEVAHALYWLLKEAANALPLFSFRYQLLFAALIYLLPRTVRLSFYCPRELSCTSMLDRDNISYWLDGCSRSRLQLRHELLQEELLMLQLQQVSEKLPQLCSADSREREACVSIFD